MDDGVVVKEKTIGEHRFVVRKISALDQFRLMTRLMSALGEGIGGARNIELPTSESNPMDWISLIGTVAGSTDPEKAVNLTMEIIGIAKVEFDGQLQEMNHTYFNRVFNDDLISSWKLAAFVLEVQFSDFLSPLRAAFEKSTLQEAKSTTKGGGKLPQAS